MHRFAAVVLCLFSLPVFGGESPAEWKFEKSRGPFVVRSDAALDSADEIEAELFRLRDDVESTLALRTVADSSEVRIQVNLFSTERAYRKHLATRAPEAAARPACFIQGGDLGRVYVVRQGDWRKNLRHEATHALMHQSLPFVPIWLDEGLAVYFEAPRETRVRRHHYLATMRWQTRLGWKPDLAALEARETLEDMRPGDYRQSWAWVHFLLHESAETRSALLEHLREIGSDVPPGALSLTLRDTVPDAPSRLVKHLETWRK